jgi:hypothetical protein
MHTGVHSGGTGITRHSRTRMVLTAYGVLSPATNSSCHRRRRMDGPHARLGLKTFADLTPATGARTTRFCRTQLRRSSYAPDHSREARPAILLRAQRCRVHRIPHPTSVTIREAPLMRDGMARTNHRFRKNRSQLFFVGTGDPISLMRLTKFVFARRRFFVPLRRTTIRTWT